MKKRLSPRLLVEVLVMAVAACLLAVPALAEGPTAIQLMGQDMPDFSLPSNQGRLVNYEKDYYGKHHLILTFFPAAFTPV